MEFKIYKVKFNSTFVDKKGVERNVISFAIKVNEKFVLIKPIHNDQYAVLDALCEFVDLTKKD